MAGTGTYQGARLTYVREVVDPLMVALLHDLLTDLPAHPTDYTINWLRARSKSGSVRPLSLLQQNKKLKQEMALMTGFVPKVGEVVAQQGNAQSKDVVNEMTSTISVSVRLSSGAQAWGPQNVPTFETIRRLRFWVAEGMGVSERRLQLLIGDCFLDPESSLVQLCMSAGENVQPIELTVVVSSWQHEVDSVFSRFLSLPADKLSTHNSTAGPTGAEIPLLLEDLSRACGSLPEEVATWLELLLKNGAGFEDADGCRWFSFPFSLSPSRNTHGLLYVNSHIDEDSVIVFWVDLFGKFAELLGLPAKLGAGSVWTASDDCDIFDSKCRKYSSIPDMAQMPSLDTWKKWLESGNVLEPEGNHGCDPYPMCLASSLTDFFERWAATGRQPRWEGVQACDQTSVADGLLQLQLRVDEMVKRSREVAERALVRVTFDLLDADADGALNLKELKPFAELVGLIGFPDFGLQEEMSWSGNFDRICRDFGSDASEGLDFASFASLAGTRRDEDDFSLRDIIRRLREPLVDGDRMCKPDQLLWDLADKVDTFVSSSNSSDEFVCFQGAAVAHERIFFSPFDGTALLAYHVTTGEITSFDVSAFAKGPNKFERVMYAIGKIIIMPSYASKMLVYELEKNEVRGVRILPDIFLPIRDRLGDIKHLQPQMPYQPVKAACIVGHALVMVPGHSGATDNRMVFWDVETERFVKSVNIEGTANERGEEINLFQGDVFMVTVEDQVVVVPTGVSKLLFCDPATYAIEVIDTSGVEDFSLVPGYRYTFACHAAGKVIGVPCCAQKLLICDIATKSVRGVDVARVATGDDRFGEAVAVGNKVIAVPQSGNQVLIVDVAEDEVRGVDVTEIATGEAKFSICCCAADGKVFAAPRVSGKILVFDAETEVARGVDVSNVYQADGTENEWDFQMMAATSNTIVMAHDWGHVLLVYHIAADVVSIVNTALWLPSSHWLALPAPELDES